MPEPRCCKFILYIYEKFSKESDKKAQEFRHIYIYSIVNVTSAAFIAPIPKIFVIKVAILQHESVRYQQTHNLLAYMMYICSILSLQCAVPENIHTPHTEGIGMSWGMGGSGRSKNIKKCMKLYWNFQRGGEVFEKIPSMGEVWIFSGTTQCIIGYSLANRRLYSCSPNPNPRRKRGPFYQLWRALAKGRHLLHI